MSKGRSIRLFLVDGIPNGLMTAEIVNWTGHVLTAPRSRLKDLLKREECARTGVYFLIGENAEDPYKPLVYVGESDDVAKRLTQHNRPEDQNGKDFWEKVCLITSKDQNLTKSHIKFLESELLTLAHNAATCVLQNTTNPTYEHLPESDVADMKFFIQQIRTILPVLGLNFLQDSRRSLMPDSPASASAGMASFVLTLPRGGGVAYAKEIDGEMIVEKGSNVRQTWVGAPKSSCRKLYHDLIELGVITDDVQGRRHFTQDYAFSSPSAAAAVVTGRPANGRTEWKETTSRQTYGQWQDKQLEDALNQHKTLKE